MCYVSVQKITIRLQYITIWNFQGYPMTSQRLDMKLGNGRVTASNNDVQECASSFAIGFDMGLPKL